MKNKKIALVFRLVNRFKNLHRNVGTLKAECESQDMPIVDNEPKSAKIRAYGWGLSANGEIGCRELCFPTKHPRPLDFTYCAIQIPFSKKHKVKTVACGHGFSVFVINSSAQPSVFGCGLNTNGQLGCQLNPKNRSKSLSWLVDPTPIDLPMRSKTTKVTHVACGFGHTLIATDNEGIFSLGNNAHGQCGRKPVEDEDYGVRSTIHNMRCFKRPVKQLVCGLDHSMVLTDDGRIWTFGLGSDGQLGNDSFATDWEPSIVKGDIENEKIVQVASSGDCCLAVSDNKEVFGWGNSEYKQLSSVTSGTMVGSPKKLNLNVEKVKRVAVGGSVCLLLTESGHVYSWGYGFLGHGPENVAKSTPQLLPLPLFGANAYNEDIKVVDIAAGVMNFAAINSIGDLYVWGKNEFGSLGLGHENQQFFPFRVELKFNVVSIAMAMFHTIALVKM